MSTYTQIIYQIVFGTYFHEPTLVKKNRDEMFRYMAGIIKNNNSHVYIINGVENHIHIVTHLHPSVALADPVKDIKLATGKWIKDNHLFKNFNGWQEGYGAFTYSIKEKERLIKYVENQEEHHRKKSFLDEYKKLLSEHGIEFNEKYLL